MTKPTYEDALAFLEAQDIKLYDYQKEMLETFWDSNHLFDEVIKPFQVPCEPYKPIENQQIYISTADMHDNPFAKMVREYLENNTKESDDND